MAMEWTRQHQRALQLYLMDTEQREVAKELGVSKHTISRWLNGHVSTVRLSAEKEKRLTEMLESGLWLMNHPDSWAPNFETIDSTEALRIYLCAVMDARGVSRRQLAKQAHLQSPQTLDQLLDGMVNLWKPDILAAVAMALEIPFNKLPIDSGEQALLLPPPPSLHNCSPVPAFDLDAWGSGAVMSGALDDVEVVQYVPYFGDVRNKAACRVRGDSMSPEYQENDWIICDLTAEPKNGDVVVVRTGGDEVRVKVWRRFGDQAILSSRNPSVEDIEIDVADVDWAYPVVAMYRDKR